MIKWEQLDIVMLIPLTEGQTTMVDDDDFEALSKFQWNLKKDKVNAYARCRKNGILMHRFLMNPPREMDVDHIDGNGLNNQKKNLRMCTRADNAANCKKHRDNRFGLKGVTFLKTKSNHKKPWLMQINVGGIKEAKCFATAIEAAMAYDDAAIRRYGEFAKTNKGLGLLP